MAENFTFNEANDIRRANYLSIERNFACDMAKTYAAQRREKAERQKQDERNGISKASEHKWDEMQSYRYAIL